ncbi:pyridine nucleotide-disulfide oxidoreductase [Streptomyces viridochromogenes]|uniref:Pyridine nucleotide-disulfide oxidoreductase n=1 Tax=Streptomyces viridochromogenes TaxID=1938 RepID=A0A0J7ZFZ1_STRVR|nr:FAD-dependent oxidoreductase [Streptomyces viridochromogenes]KMS74083.1 pyridine nucleotide-disulfide oxidoreductase [Streptomyces viridochromogenes]
MAVTPSRTGTPVTPDTDLIIIGGGPAGCAAARMAASVGMRSVLIEPDALCRNLYRIQALNNVLGGYTSGPELADSITAELKSTSLCRIELGQHVTSLRATDDHVTATLDSCNQLSASHVIVATGVGPLQPKDAPWITAPSGLTLPPLWQAEEDHAEGRTLLVLGGDRPIGTFLRAHPTTDMRLLVTYPPSDDYKIEEIQDDPRVALIPADHVTLYPSETAALAADIVGRDGGDQRVSADFTFLSIGTAPTAPNGDLVRDTAGYCPTSHQHPRVIIAGDLRSARFQRIMTAMGSGSEAALHAYYATRDLLPENSR